MIIEFVVVFFDIKKEYSVVAKHQKRKCFRD
nr:MAG TPA: hypothetical protein [Caudoviricetes sp.]DAS52161.1 MAG TPA: hypothetical protein [Caudoviricetes sp.]DAW30890.1 MAG TPA: hypothetical protein [Caudoviricetes sp.]